MAERRNCQREYGKLRAFRRNQMHRDSKERNRAVKSLTDKRTRIPKHPNPDALRNFKEVPYRLRYGKEKKDAE